MTYNITYYIPYKNHGIHLSSLVIYDAWHTKNVSKTTNYLRYKVLDREREDEIFGV